MKTFLSLLLVVHLVSCSQSVNSKQSVKIPNTLNISKSGQEFQLLQRSKKEISSTPGKAYCEIGDITGGQTWVKISDDSLVVFEKSIHENDTVQFTFGNEKFRLICLEMVNELIGDDFATFKILK